MINQPRIVDIVFASRSEWARLRVALSVGAALALHIALVAWLAGQKSPPEKPKERPPLEVSMAPPPPAPPAQAAPVQPPDPSAQPSEPAAAQPPVHHVASKPAAAARVLTRKAEPAADFTGSAFVTGTAASAPGGVTQAGGTGTEPGGIGTAEHGAPEAQPPPPKDLHDLSRPVHLHEDDWHCDWPTQADDAGIDQQTVVLRVVVAPSGQAVTVQIVTDPGHGFAAAARLCAQRTLFQPARDAQGRPVRATSPPIRVRFTR